MEKIRKWISVSRPYWLAMVLLLNFSTFGAIALLYGAPAGRLAVDSNTSVGVSLGTYTLVNNGATEGNVLTLPYGNSVEGGSLITYWPGGQVLVSVIAMGGSQYELVENTKKRCVTAAGRAVTLSTCSGSPSQLITLTAQGSGFTMLAASGNCVEAPASFSTLQANPCDGSAVENWSFNGSTRLSLTPVAAPAVSSAASSTVPAGYHLTFDDEFTALNLSDQNGAGTNWYTHTVQCCLSDTSAPGTPTYMAGFTAPAGQNPYSLITGGGLNIRLQKTNGAWYSGVLATVDSNGQGFAQQYGYFEMKAQFPSALGTWPAFWLLNQAALTKKANAGEIDVVESYMQFPTYINTTLHDWTPPATTPGYQKASVADLSKGFHTFGMLWTASKLTFYSDGALLYSMPTPPIMNQPYYPIVDLGLGGGWPTSQTPQQSNMIVKYVRVYAPSS